MKNTLSTFIKSHFKFKLNTFILSLSIFPFLVVFGTLSHEFGHILMAKILGYQTILHYGSMNWSLDGIDGELVSSNFHNFLVTLGGPLQTMLTGTLGLMIISRKTSKRLKWIGVFLALFWSRETINLLIGLVNGLFLNNAFFGGDELILSNLLGLPDAFLSILLGFLGFVACLYTLYKIDVSERISFLSAGLISGILTYFLWFGYLGKIILP